jgi:mycothiol synthase
MDIEITRFDPVCAPESDLAEHFAVTLAISRLQFPEQPAPTFDFYKAFLHTAMTAWGPRLHWCARDGGRIVGTATVDLLEPESPDTAIIQVLILPEMRRRGIGTALLQETLATCRTEGRETIVASSMKSGGDREAWTRSLGFTKVAEWVRQSLSIADADPALWQVQEPDGYRAMLWTGAAPEEVVAGFARARTAIHDAPFGESSLPVPEWTVERVRRHEADAQIRGGELHTAVAIHDATGTIAGLTQLEIQDGLLNTAFQQDTSVLPEYRGHGLGRFVKATMVRRLTVERPQITHVLTKTDANNTHMIRVNHQLGYTTDHTLINLETTLEALQRRLSS